ESMGGFPAFARRLICTFHNLLLKMPLGLDQKLFLTKVIFASTSKRIAKVFLFFNSTKYFFILFRDAIVVLMHLIPVNNAIAFRSNQPGGFLPENFAPVPLRKARVYQDWHNE